MTNCNPKLKIKEVLLLNEMLTDNLKKLNDLVDYQCEPRDWWHCSERAEFRRLRIQLSKKMKELDERLYC